MLARLKVREMLLGELHKGLVWDPTSTRKNHAVRLVICGDIISQILSLYRQDVLFGAEDGTAERLALECCGVKMVKDNLFKLFIHLFLFAEDHIAFAFDGMIF